MRVAAEHLARLGNAHLLEHAQCLGAWRRAASMRWCSRIDSAIWSPTGNTGLSDVIGSWKIIAISAPRMPRIGDGFARARSTVVPPGRAKRSAPLHDASATVLDEAHHRQRRHALARARLADHGDRLAAADRHRQVAHGRDDALGRAELDGQVLDREDGGRGGGGHAERRVMAGRARRAAPPVHHATASRADGALRPEAERAMSTTARVRVQARELRITGR